MTEFCNPCDIISVSWLHAIDELINEIVELKKSVKKVSESCPTETKIKTLEEEVKILKLEIKGIFAFSRNFSRENRKIPDVKSCEEVPDLIIHNIPNNKIHEEVRDVKSTEEIYDS